MSDEAEQQLKSADLDTQTKTKEQMQTCLDALGEKMKAAAKDDATTKASTDAADETASSAEADADKLVADIEAGKTSNDESDSSTGSVSDEEWNEMLNN
jgi:small-conductance mechanosensitive channel